MLNETVDKEVDWSGRCKTPVGASGQVKPRRSDSDEEAHRPPHGKRASWSGKQLNGILYSNTVYENNPYKKVIARIF